MLVDVAEPYLGLPGRALEQRPGELRLWMPRQVDLVLGQLERELARDRDVERVAGHRRAKARLHGDLGGRTTGHGEHGDIERAATHVEDEQPTRRTFARGEEAVPEPGHAGRDRFVDESRLGDG